MGEREVESLSRGGVLKQVQCDSQHLGELSPGSALHLPTGVNGMQSFMGRAHATHCNLHLLQNGAALVQYTSKTFLSAL